MTSKISFSNIAKEDLRRRLWMLALSCLGSFLALPVTFLLVNRNYLDRASRYTGTLTTDQILGEYYVEFFTSYALITQGIILTVGAAIVAIWGFRYLYSRKMVDLYHSIPVKRSRLFLVTYLNGLLIWLIPLVAATLITLLIMLANLISRGGVIAFGSVILMALRQMLVCLCCFLIFYHFILVCVMLSGNAFNAIYSSLILGIFVAAFYALFHMLCEAFWDTFISPVINWRQILWASPLVGPIIMMNDFSNTGINVLFGTATSTYDQPDFFWICSILLMTFNLWMARRLYLKRPSELAEHGVDHKHAQTLIRLCSSILAAIFGGMIFLWLVDKEAISWQIFGILLCGILVFGISDIILHMNFKSFLAHKRQMGIGVLFSCLLLLTIAFDLTGFDSRLPDKENIRSANITLSGYTDGSQILQFTEGGIAYLDYEARGRGDYQNLDILYPLLQTLTDEEHKDADNNWATTIVVRLQTDFGPFNRRYRILQSDLEALRPLVESDEYRELFYPIASGLFPQTKKLQVNSELNYSEFTTTEDDKIQEILDAYTADFTDNYSIEKINTGLRVGQLQLNYDYAGSEIETLRSYDISLRIFSHYTRTIEKIKEYYPDLTLEKEDLQIASLQVIPDSMMGLHQLFDLNDINAENAAQEESKQTGSSDTSVTTDTGTVIMVSESTVPMATSEAIDEVTIINQEEIQALFPYLQIGDISYNQFDNLQPYTFFGSVRLTDGSYVSCYVLEEDLPLEAPETIKQFVAEKAGKDSAE